MKFLHAAAALLLAAGVANAGMPAVHLVSNRAVYDVRLAHTTPGAAVAARGRMAVEFRDVCDGWTTTQRLITDVIAADGSIERSDDLVASWESKDGRLMRFDVRHAAAGRRSHEKRGSAWLAGNGSGAANLLAPRRRRFALPGGTVFPTGQLLAVLGAARRGLHRLEGDVFQGGDESDLYLSVVTVGRAVRETDRGSVEAALVKGVPGWPVLASYYPLRGGRETPDYEVAARVYGNGIIGSMSFIYPRYTLEARLTRLEPLAARC